MRDGEYDAYVAERLSRFGDRGSRHGALATITVPIMVRVGREINLRLTRLARQIGLKRATLLAQIAELVSCCDGRDWFRACAAFQRVAEPSMSEAVKRAIEG